jgi:hypothetical protein
LIPRITKLIDPTLHKELVGKVIILMILEAKLLQMHHLELQVQSLIGARAQTLDPRLPNKENNLENNKETMVKDRKRLKEVVNLKATNRHKNKSITLTQILKDY